MELRDGEYVVTALGTVLDHRAVISCVSGAQTTPTVRYTPNSVRWANPLGRV